MEDIEQAFEDGLVDEWFIDLGWVRERLALGKNRALDDLRRHRKNRYIGNTIDEIEWWACFDAP